MVGVMRELFPKNLRKIELPAAGELQKEHIRVRRSLSDMPLPAAQLNVVSAVCLYTLIGLSDRDIAEALVVDLQRVERIKMLDAYATIQDQVVKSIIDEEASDVRSIFAANARNAALTMVSLAKDADNEVVKFKANQDVLDRAGHRPADVVLVKGQIDSTLRVVYVEEDDCGVVIDGKAVSVSEE
jgi:hypothetical protein